MSQAAKISIGTPPATAVTQVMVTSTSTGSAIKLDYQLLENADLHRAVRAQREQLENAVYGYMRAIRALGRTTVDVAEVSRALNITIPQVQSTLPALLTKGVRIA